MKGNVRLVGSLVVISMLAVFLLYAALAGGSVSRPVVDAGEIDAHRELAAAETVEFVGVAQGPVERDGDRMTFSMTGMDGGPSTRVEYSGTVPDVFRVGRSVVVRGMLDGDTFVAERNTLSTKCPSRFEAHDEGA